MTDPITPDTVQHLAVTVSEPDERGNCRVTRADGCEYLWADYVVRANDLTVPEPTVPCTIGDIEFTLTREQVEKLTGLYGSIGDSIRPAARRWVDRQGGAS